jgi:CelD/BcsL family acetyltransferase involved in cellulose biosynthesis
MNVLALRPLLAASRPFPAADTRIAIVEIFEDLTAAEPHWRALEQADALASPYQRYDFLKLWQRHVGAPAGIAPFIVAGFNERGEALLLWPFGARKVAGLRIVEFLGGKHVNFNMGLWRRDLAGAIDAGAIRAVLDHLAGRADVLRLVNQPLTWAGATNPFGLLPNQRAVDFGFSGALTPDFDALLRSRTTSSTRKKMRQKERALAEHGPVLFTQAREPEEMRRVLDVFFKQKSARMQEKGVRDAFATPDVRRFVEAVATEHMPGGEPLIEAYALSVGDIVVATFAGIAGGGRFCGMFNSIANERYTAESPGEQLLMMVVRRCCERGLATFDLGVGQASYKRLFCPDAEPLFDSYLPLRAAARPLAGTFAAIAAAKRGLKQNASLWRVVGALRGLRARVSPDG